MAQLVRDGCQQINSPDGRARAASEKLMVDRVDELGIIGRRVIDEPAEARGILIDIR